MSNRPLQWSMTFLQRHSVPATFAVPVVAPVPLGTSPVEEPTVALIADLPPMLLVRPDVVPVLDVDPTPAVPDDVPMAPPAAPLAFVAT
jgi:hypothetical protein